MPAIALEEIEIPGCYSGRLSRFQDWRRALAEMLGVAVWYCVVEKAVTLTSLGPHPAPARLPFVETMAAAGSPLGGLTPQQRLGDWDPPPSEPLWILLALTLPGGVVRHYVASAMAERLAEMTELMFGIDDGSRGMGDLGRFTETMCDGLRRIAAGGTDAVIRGGYEPTGWWDVAGAFEA